MNLVGMNLNLLKILAVVHEERNLTVAGERLGLTQSAVSQALKRLRHIFGDDLYVRNGHLMTPTARALELGDKVREALASLEQALSSAQFDPATSSRHFVIASGEYNGSVLLPEVMAIARVRAPHARFSVVPLTASLGTQLEDGSIDVAINGFTRIPPGLSHDSLFSDHVVLTIRKGHPMADADMSASDIAQFGMIGVDLALGEDDGGFVTRLGLSQWGSTGAGSNGFKSDACSLVVTSFYAAMAAAARSDMVAAVPLRLARLAAPFLGLIHRPSPLLRGAGEIISLWRDDLGDQSAAHRWLRTILKEAAAGLHPPSGSDNDATTGRPRRRPRKPS